jgi:hypothetical protein
VDNFSESESRRFELITQIQVFHNEGCSVAEISRRLGKSGATVKKYLTGEPEILCRTNKKGIVSQYTGFIIQCIIDGMTQTEIANELRSQGYNNTDSNARRFIRNIASSYQLELKKHIGSKRSKKTKTGSTNSKFDYITRAGIFQYLWMNGELTSKNRKYIWDKYPVLYELERCIKEFRDIFTMKNMPKLYLFIEKNSALPIKEISTFASGLDKDIDAVENAVASDLSNGFVEGTNNKLKMVKRTMYGRCGKELLAAKLMYKNG